jgi:hypothetical protein
MRCIAGALALLPLVLNVSAAKAAQLTDIEKAFVASAATVAMVVVYCDAKVVKDGLPKLADRLGIDTDLLPAVRAAFQVSNDLPYERSDLIPAVTQLYRMTYVEIQNALQDNKPKTCKRLLDMMRQVGTIE